MRRRKPKPNDPAFARLTVAAVALEFGRPQLSLDLAAKGDKQLVFSRQVAMYLMQTVFDINATRTAELFGRDRSTVAHAIKVIDESREDPVFDRKLLQIESFLTNGLTAFGETA